MILSEYRTHMFIEYLLGKVQMVNMILKMHAKGLHEDQIWIKDKVQVV